MTYEIAGVKNNAVTYASYVVAGIFMTFFALVSHNATSPACYGNYVIFDMIPGTMYTYASYYYGLEILALATSLHLSYKTKKTTFIILHKGILTILLLLTKNNEIRTNKTNKLNPLKKGLSN